jgi:dihydrofolate reductase
MKMFRAIAAMSLDRVIGNGQRIPWHLPEDFRWFKQTTTGHVVVMGRRTFESIGKPLPNRETIVLSRSAFVAPGVRVAHSLDEIDPTADPREFYICGGAQVYAEALPRCSDLYLTLVQRHVAGDVLFPPFEDRFRLFEIVRETPDFQIRHYVAWRVDRSWTQLTDRVSAISV